MLNEHYDQPTLPSSGKFFQIFSSPFDREIVALALPALGTLAIDPLLSMVDTAMVGRLGTLQLGALAVATVVFAVMFVGFNFLSYSTTAQVARYYGAEVPDKVGIYTVQALYLALGLGILLAGLGWWFAPQIAQVMGVQPNNFDYFLAYFRWRVLAAPAFMLLMVGHGFYRGIQNLRVPLWVVLAVNLINGGLDYLLIYPLHQGIAGAAIATLIAQVVGALAFVGLMFGGATGHLYHLRSALNVRWQQMRELVRVSGDLFFRSAAIQVSFVVASASAAHMGAVTVAAHQVGMELWVFLAMVVDAIAIAGQSLIGRYLGAGEPQRAYKVGLRMTQWGIALGFVLMGVFWLLRDLLPHLFTSDPRVLHTIASIFLFVVCFQPINSLVFVLDGILIGAGDTRFLRRAATAGALAYIPLALAALTWGWGLPGVWFGLALMMLIRLLTNWLRFQGQKWVVTGEAVPQG
ncbi:MATE family efflux transporter [Leptolyngbya sp. FACHB-261]|uniref:MATE family efflux transporter n=1 Tax=Leptolyngbya sp. FACHB-261 TaxID=2692806 RepID=UPI0016848529|nr:MATE family efflux transporter [Leptolyngbya sp. FACHB-261]MBD2102937.1 MATE family efflux transporter [Leptolyngbya sp. FACHB-261]